MACPSMLSYFEPNSILYSSFEAAEIRFGNASSSLELSVCLKMYDCGRHIDSSADTVNNPPGTHRFL